SPDVSGLFVLWQKVCENQAVRKDRSQKTKYGGKQDGRSSGGKEINKSSLAGRMGRGNRIALGGTRAAGRAEARRMVAGNNTNR
ncbi:MAG TPA: hypothetical protein VE604_13660, partial [Candidatus Polarisedimenticolia bacterium]|nr:hypothetical protein [Candidatus Polarisedimenticolia bacterium]